MSRLRASRFRLRQGFDESHPRSAVTAVGMQGTLDSAAAPGAAADTAAAARIAPLRTRIRRTLCGFGLLLSVTLLVAPVIGNTTVSLARVFDRSIPFGENVDAQIFFVARMPRIVAGALVGAALAAAGVVFQALLRNALATPFTLGVSAGASLGAMLAIVAGTTVAAGPFSAVPLASLVGAAIAASIVYRLATMQDRAMSTTVLLLAGVTLNSFFSALILFVQYIANFAQVYRATRWIMGDLDVGSFEPIAAALPLMLVAFAMFAWLPSSLNLLSVGEDAASARGVDVARTQRLAFISASIATAAAVSLAGPIGFIGIVVPHLVRLLVGVDHRLVLPASALFGASFLVVCDLAARTLLAPIEIPVGVITAMLGGPFFLWLLVRKG
jgi:iron complex transport system permease protein